MKGINDSTTNLGEDDMGFVKGSEIQDASRQQAQIRRRTVLSANANRIQTAEELALFFDVIGDQNYKEGVRLLNDGGTMWIFLSPAEVEANVELAEEEKKICRDRFGAEETWAGIYRKPKLPQKPNPWFYPTLGYDTHVGYRGGGGTGCGSDGIH